MLPLKLPTRVGVKPRTNPLPPPTASREFAHLPVVTLKFLQ